MTFRELDREIELKIEELSNKKEKERYLYISQYNQKIDSLKDFMEFDITGFISSYYYLHHDDIDILKINDFINNLLLLLDNIKGIEIEELISMLLTIKKNNDLDNLKRYLNNDNVSFLNKLKSINATMPLKIMNLKKQINKKNINIDLIIDEFGNSDETIISIMKFYQDYQKMSLVVKNIEKQKDNQKISSFVLFDHLAENIDINKMINMLKEIEDYVNEYLRINKINKKEINSLTNSRDSLEDALENKELIVNYQDIINNIKDNRMKYLFLQVIKNHNMKYLNALENEYSTLTKDTRIAIIALLNDYGIPNNSYNIEVIMRFSKEDIEKILKIIEKINISVDSKILILENTNMDNINNIKEYLDRGILNNDILKENLDMFIETTKLNNLKNNIEIIKKCNISISLFINNIHVLLEDSKLFNKNLNILSVYNLLKNIDTSNDLSYLQRNDLDTIIDKYLELNCEEYLEKDLSLLNKSNLQKLELLHFLGIGVNSKEELYTLLMDDSDFDGLKNEMDDILNNKVAINKDDININLDEYEETNRVYNFDGIKVSIIKVKRLLSFGYNLYDAITYNMYLKEEDKVKIINILTGNNLTKS